MNRRSAVVTTVVVFKRLDELLEVELLVYLDEKVIWDVNSLGRFVVNWQRMESLMWRSSGSRIVSLLKPDVRAILRRQHVPLRSRLFQQSVYSALDSSGDFRQEAVAIPARN